MAILYTRNNLRKIYRLFYRGLRICIGSHHNYRELELCTECKIAPLSNRRHMHLLLFMHKQKGIESLVKISAIRTRLHMTPVF